MQENNVNIPRYPKIRHAYLIMAHHEFEVLGKLLSVLDDERNDIFLHFDKKLNFLPSYNTRKSHLYVLKNRVDVRWGHVSQIKAEYTLFETAYRQGGYEYYHLLSGVHLPLKSQDYIHAFFEKQRGKEILAHVPNDDSQTILKMHRYHFFVRNFMHKNPAIKRLDQLLWRFCIYVQKKLCIYRNMERSYHNAANWVCVTEHCVAYLLSIRTDVLRRYRFTLCGDEFFIPSELENSPFKECVRYEDRLLKCDFGGKANPRVYHRDDYESLIHSNCLFARKFSRTDMELVDKILTYITSGE